jgi:hypothetical protein
MAEAVLGQSPPLLRQRPVCQRCGVEMTLVRIDPETPGIEQQTYECTCGNSDTLLVKFK